MLSLLAATASVSQPIVDDFDLARVSYRTVTSEDAMQQAPELPRNIDLRDFAVDMPELEIQVAGNGPVFLVGAMGGRHKGMPALAHVALGWNF